jgi:hypothetical protein
MNLRRRWVWVKVNARDFTMRLLRWLADLSTSTRNASANLVRQFIGDICRKLPTGSALEAEAERLGVTLYDIYKTKEGLKYLDEPELQRRVLAAWADRRNGRLWLLALASAVASVLSAAAAWYAVVHK